MQLKNICNFIRKTFVLHTLLSLTTEGDKDTEDLLEEKKGILSICANGEKNKKIKGKSVYDRSFMLQSKMVWFEEVWAQKLKEE